MTHKRRFVFDEQLRRLCVGEVTLTSSYSLLKMNGITSFFQQFFVVVRFKKSRMTLAEVFNNMLARCSYVREHTDCHRFAGDDETVGIAGIVKLRKSRDGEVADFYGIVRPESFDAGIIETEVSELERRITGIDTQLMFFG